MPLKEKTLLTCKELTELYGFKSSLSYKLMHRDDLPVIKLGKLRFMQRELFEEWLKEQASQGIA